jgi:light-regulated signal transduction histidine kinase (bacteriophytochrome)
MVEKRTTELQRSNEDLQQFAHVASHDLKEPVRKIRTFALRLKQELNDNASEKSKIFLEKILQSASRMSTMIEGVLTYSTFNAIEQRIEMIDLNTIISDIRNDLEVLIDQKDASIEYDALPKFEGVQVLIYQLFYNLINNSLKFSRDNEKPVIRISGSMNCIDGINYVTLIVSDNGIGFDDEYRARIFQTFTRLNPKTEYDGTGLGLSLAKKIIERHYGTIEASGQKGKGAEFRITIPQRQLIV